MRSLALAASVALVVIHRDERGAWFWVGLALVVLNVGGFLTTSSRADRGERSTASHCPGDLALDSACEGRQSHRLDELLSLPVVAAAFATGPRLWRQVSYLDDTQFEPTTAEELAAFVWIENDEGWAIGLGDELKPYVDLDIDEAVDPVITVLKNHPAVSDAFHEDREVYRIEQRRPISTEEFAELAAWALVSHHMHAATRS
jgi:hypothetical protein